MLCLLIQFYRHEHIKGFAINDQRQAVFTVAGDWPGEFPKNVFWGSSCIPPFKCPQPAKAKQKLCFWSRLINHHALTLSLKTLDANCRQKRDGFYI